MSGRQEMRFEIARHSHRGTWTGRVLHYENSRTLIDFYYGKRASPEPDYVSIRTDDKRRGVAEMLRDMADYLESGFKGES